MAWQNYETAEKETLEVLRCGLCDTPASAKTPLHVEGREKLRCEPCRGK